MMRLLCFLSFFTLATSAVRADQYWIAYEGNDFPENEGWTRIWNPPLARRWIEQGSLVIDSRASGATNEWYEWYRDAMDPEPGQLFIVQWRLLVEELSIGWEDPVVSVSSEGQWLVGFGFDEGTIRSVFEPGLSAPFQPGVFHTFELRSPDMRTYELYIDSGLAMEGSFWLSLTPPSVAWGDGVSGGASLTRWDYFRFGVVPEPHTGLLMALSLASRRALR